MRGLQEWRDKHEIWKGLLADYERKKDEAEQHRHHWKLQVDDAKKEVGARRRASARALCSIRDYRYITLLCVLCFYLEKFACILAVQNTHACVYNQGK